MTPLPVAILLEKVADLLGGLPCVEAVAFGESYFLGRGDAGSDLDPYVYARDEPPVAARQALVTSRAVPGTALLNDRRFEPGDAWFDRDGMAVDVMSRRSAWIEDRLSAVIDRAEARLGYSTCLGTTSPRAG